MKFLHKNGLKLLQFETPPEKWPLSHAISTRCGGISRPPFDSLNIGFSTGDIPGSVIKNRALICEAIGAPAERFVSMRQVHSANVLRVDFAGRFGGLGPPGKIIAGADALVTDIRGVTLLAMSADCALTLFFDPVKNVLGVSHSGWRGTLKNVYANVVKTMSAGYGSRPKDIFAGISPVISRENYEVGKDLISRFRRLYPEAARSFYTFKGGKYYLSIESVLVHQLKQLGIRRIETAGMCTAGNPDLFYSYRRDGRKTGSFGLFTCMRPLRCT